MTARESALEALAIVNKGLKDALVEDERSHRNLIEHCIAKDLEFEFESAAETRTLLKRFELLKEKPDTVVEILEYDPMKSSNDGIHEGQNPNHLLFDGTALQIFRKLVLRACLMLADLQNIFGHVNSVRRLIRNCEDRGVDSNEAVYRDATKTLATACDIIDKAVSNRMTSISKALHNRAFANGSLYGQRNRCLTEFLVNEPLHQNQSVADGEPAGQRAFRVYDSAQTLFQVALAAHKAHAANWSRRDMATAMDVLKRNGVWEHVTVLGKRKFADLGVVDADDADEADEAAAE